MTYLPLDPELYGARHRMSCLHCVYVHYINWPLAYCLCIRNEEHKLVLLVNCLCIRNEGPWSVGPKCTFVVMTCPWWRHQMETLSALLALCAGNSPANGEFPSQRPITRSFDVFFDLRLNKRLSKHSIRRWFETPSRSLWRHSNALGHLAVAVLFGRHTCYPVTLLPCLCNSFEYCVPVDTVYQHPIFKWLAATWQDDWYGTGLVVLAIAARGHGLCVYVWTRTRPLGTWTARGFGTFIFSTSVILRIYPSIF